MISAAQIREACALLGWMLPMLAERSMLCFDEASLALDDVGVRWLGGLQLGAIRQALDGAGIEFTAENDVPGVRLRQSLPRTSERPSRG